MLKIAHVHQVKSISGFPAQLINTIHEAVSILDNEYGEDRDIDSGYGGYGKRATTIKMQLQFYT